MNTLHAHSLPWVDKPLMIAEPASAARKGLADAGVSVSKLILNPWLFLEATGEVYQGNSGVFQSYERSDVSWVGRLRGYRDVTESTNVDVGGSFAYGTQRRRPGFHDAARRRRCHVPLPSAAPRDLPALPGRAPSSSGAGAVRRTATCSAFGMYASGEYQFARRWFAGARYDWSERAYDASLVDKGPSLVLTFWPSEFSQIRGQYRRTRYAEGVDRERVAVPVPVLDRRARRACVLKSAVDVGVSGASCESQESESSGVGSAAARARRVVAARECAGVGPREH